MNQEKIGKFIAKCRKEKEMTQQDLAEKLGVSDRTVGNWERGRNMPDISLIKPLCNELGISVNDLIDGEIINKEELSKKADNNLIKVLTYVSKKIDNIKKQIYECSFLIGIGLIIISFAIFPSENGIGLIYMLIGILLSVISFFSLNKRFNLLRRIFYSIGYLLFLVFICTIIDHNLVTIYKEKPRIYFDAIYTNNNSYYNIPFKDIVICNEGYENETFNIIKNGSIKLKKDIYKYLSVNEYCLNK